VEKETSVEIVKLALTVRNISAIAETDALNAQMSVRVVQNIAKTVRECSVKNAGFALIV